MARAGIEPATFRFSGGRSYQLSYLAGRHCVHEKCLTTKVATLTGLEPATSAVTGRRANQLRHRALLYCSLRRHRRCAYPQRDSNPCYRRERAGSWAARRWGPDCRIRVMETIRSQRNDSGMVSAARAGSSVGTSVRLKSGRSAVRPRPCPPSEAAGQSESPTCGFLHPCWLGSGHCLGGVLPESHR